MIIFKKKSDLSKYLENQIKNDKKIGFVPTMGALHLGHISLIVESKSENDCTVCSIFINPTQFNDKDDFYKYPVSIEEDIELLEENGCDILFLPDQSEIYPQDFVKINYDIGALENCLEGLYRPGHYQGVCMVVDKLLSIVNCDHLYLGQKDYQQCKVIEKLLKINKSNTQLHITPTIREKNGLAMSSRNRRLSKFEKEKAGILYTSLLQVKNNLKEGDLSNILTNASKKISDAEINIEYFVITDLNLNMINSWDGNTPLIVLIAARINQVRLIDNMIIA